MIKTRGILIVANVEAILANSCLINNCYIIDESSPIQGEREVITACNPKDKISWKLSMLSPSSTIVQITDIKIDPKICSVTRDKINKFQWHGAINENCLSGIFPYIITIAIAQHTFYLVSYLKIE